MKGRKVESCNRIKDGNGRLAQGQDKLQWIWKEYLKICIDSQEQVAVHICGYDGIRRGNYFGGEPIRIAEFQMRVGKLKNRKAAGKDEITQE